MLTNHTKLLLISSLIFCGLIRPAFAQTQFAGWLATFQNYQLSSRTSLLFDAQWRSTGQLKQTSALLFRPGFNLYFTPSLSGAVGYAYFPQQRISSGLEDYLPEHRIWEQMLFTHPVKIVASHADARRAEITLTHRLRLEQRWVPHYHAENGDLVHDGNRYTGRFRYYARALVPLSRQKASLSAPGSETSSTAPARSAAFTKGWFAAVQNELFINVSNTSAVNGKGFDQNRAYLAAGYRVNKQFDIELGYLNQYVSGAGSSSTNSHIVQLATYLRL